MKDLTPLIAALVAFLATAGLGYIIIPYLKRLKFGQTILDIGPNWHKDKQGTPTMGGIMMIAGVPGCGLHLFCYIRRPICRRT